MIRRPKPGESEDDILRMQEEFLKDKNFQPAAQVVNLRKTEHQTTKRANSSPSSSARKPSKYAQSKGLANIEKRARTETSTGSLMGDILEKNMEETEEKPVEPDDDKVYYPKVIPSILGNIVEKNVSFTNDRSLMDFKLPSIGFPEVTKRDPSVKPGPKSIYAQNIEMLKKDKNIEMDVDQSSSSKLTMNEAKHLNFPQQSYIVSSQEANTIHDENIKVLSEMSEDEILQEQQKLLTTLDSKLINFLKNRRNQSKDSKESVLATNSDEVKMDVIEHKPETEVEESDNKFESDSLWENDILTHPQVSNWLHFENLEKDKLEWMKGIEESRKIKSDEPYEARFDFKGYLLPYTIEYTEKTKSLFHHGDEPHRPGYSVTELFELSRSSVTQQRVMSLNTLAGLLEYNSTGIYKNIIELPLSKIFFVIRIAMDENKVILLEPALKAMRNLLLNRIDEACLDAMLGFEEGTFQPCLENDKSEIQDLESKESELKDFHLAEIDLIAAILRTDILQRLYYILETMKPSFNCVQYALQILTRLSRDSTETARNIVDTDHLMNTILKNFIPTTSINFMFDPNIIYNGKPILAALKLLRILSLQSKEIGEILLSKYDLLRPISEYISSGVDGTYGLRLQIEAFCILSNLLNYGLGTENALSLCPLVITALYKQGTEICLSTSVITATHAAVVLQFIAKLLNCNMLNLDGYKQQIYPLLKEAVQKWLMQMAHFDNYTCGHLRLLCSAVDCCKTILLNEKVTLKFLNDTLKMLSMSSGFKLLISNLSPSSNLLSGIDDNELYSTKNLVTLKTSVIDSPHKVLPILNIVSPIPFLVSIFKLLNVVNEKELGKLYVNQIINYIADLSRKPPSLTNNWFTRMEVELVFSIVRLAIQSNISETIKDLIYAVASKLCYILRVDKKYELEYLFKNIIFNKEWFTAERLLNLVSLSEADSFSNAITNVEDIKACYSKVININSLVVTGNVVLKQWQEPVLPRDWIYLPILSLYSKSQEVKPPTVVGENANRAAQQLSTERELIIRSSLEWILFNEICFPDLLNDINHTDRFCRLMCVFLCDNSLFLEDKIKTLLRKCIQVLFKKRDKFDFDKELTGLHNFQDFYTQFLEQFQSVSYGDRTFAACVLVPLAQRHNVKWRKLLWSEYAGCLRALDCPESDLCYTLNDYLYPEETEETLLKSYFRALSSNLLRPGTISYKIAHHHVECYKKRKSLTNEQ